MDEFSIGSSGFAQVGQPYYNEKQRIEKKVLFEYVLKKTVFPTEFLNLAFFKWKANSHDFGTYHDLVIMAHSSIRDMEDSEDPEEVERYYRFMDWVNEVESIDLECEEVLEACRIEFNNQYPMAIIHRKDTSEDNDELKAV